MADVDHPIRFRDAEPDMPAEPDFASVYRTEAPWLVRFFRRQLGNPDDAQDLAQETMLRFLRIAPSTAVATPQAYLRRIATNLLRDRFESGPTKLARRSVPLIEGLDRASDFDQHRALASREELARWDAILSALKPRTLDIFLLSRIDGLTYKEIAARFGMSSWTVKKHMMKAIAHIDRHRREL